MANADGERKVRQEFRRKLKDWGMDELELELCMLEVDQRRKQKVKGKLPMDADLCTRPSYLALRHKNAEPRVPAGMDAMIVDGKLLGGEDIIKKRKSVSQQLKAAGVTQALRRRIHQRMCIHDSRRAQYGVLYFMMGWFYDR